MGEEQGAEQQGPEQQDAAEREAATEQAAALHSRRTEKAERDSVFISYRRSDSEHVSGRLASPLREEFGGQRVFFDTQRIKGGEDFSERIDTELARAGRAGDVG
jgi:hypothetical protein